MLPRLVVGGSTVRVLLKDSHRKRLADGVTFSYYMRDSQHFEMLGFLRV